jgi:F-type H+-transporting ATPase subunit a
MPLIFCIFLFNFKAFIAHLLPYGSPYALCIFLPIVEIFSQLIRPVTLIIRLRTNLSAGHIIMYMFSYFTLLSPLLSPFLYFTLTLLLFLEFAISMLQAYIFVSLMALYLEE